LCEAIAKPRIFPPFLEFSAEQNQVRPGRSNRTPQVGSLFSVLANDANHSELFTAKIEKDSRPSSFPAQTRSNTRNVPPARLPVADKRHVVA
jgi:hypothetical protein